MNEKPSVIQQYLNALPDMDGISADLVRRKAYIQDMGLHYESALDLVKVYPELDYVTGTSMEVYAKRYASAGINSLFGMSWSEFLNSTVPEVRMLLKVAEELNSKVTVPKVPK